MSDSSQTTKLPARFEDADLDHLVLLIGIAFMVVSSHVYPPFFSFFPADMLQRLISHNDKIPLSP
jgi:hypothetical protein